MFLHVCIGPYVQREGRHCAGHCINLHTLVQRLDNLSGPLFYMGPVLQLQYYNTNIVVFINPKNSFLSNGKKKRLN